MEQCIIHYSTNMMSHNPIYSRQAINYKVTFTCSIHLISYTAHPAEKDIFIPRFRVVVKWEFILPPEQFLLGKNGKTYAVDTVTISPFRLPRYPYHFSASVLGSFADGKCGKSFTQ